MEKIFIFLLSIPIFTNFTNSNVGPSEEDVATFNKNVETWKMAANGFTSEDPEKVMSIFADSLKWNNPEALMEFTKTRAAVNFYINNFDNITFTKDDYYGGSLYSTDQTS